MQNSFGILQLIDSIETVISKNRDLLTVEDLDVLTETVKVLTKMRSLNNKKAVVEYAALAIQVVLNVLRFFEHN